MKINVKFIFIASIVSFFILLSNNVSANSQCSIKTVVGDWNGDGKTKIGIFRNGTWYLDADGNGIYESDKDMIGNR